MRVAPCRDRCHFCAAGCWQFVATRDWPLVRSLAPSLSACTALQSRSPSGFSRCFAIGPLSSSITLSRIPMTHAFDAPASRIERIATPRFMYALTSSCVISSNSCLLIIFLDHVPDAGAAPHPSNNSSMLTKTTAQGDLRTRFAQGFSALGPSGASFLPSSVCCPKPQNASLWW